MQSWLLINCGILAQHVSKALHKDEIRKNVALGELFITNKIVGWKWQLQGLFAENGIYKVDLLPMFFSLDTGSKDVSNTLL